MDIPSQGMFRFWKAKNQGKYTCPEKYQDKYTHPNNQGKYTCPRVSILALTEQIPYNIYKTLNITSSTTFH